MAFKAPVSVREEVKQFETFSLEIDDGEKVHRLRLDFESSAELEFWKPYLEQWRQVVELTKTMEKK